MKIVALILVCAALGLKWLDYKENQPCDCNSCRRQRAS